LIDKVQFPTIIFFMKNAIIYTRVSTEKQVQDGIGLEAQLAKCQQYAELQGWQVIGTYTDEGISGKTTDRDGLQDALTAVKRTKGVLVCYSLSRLSRSVLDTLTMVEDLQKSKADLASVSENIDTAGPCGRFQLNVMSAMNQLEREQVSERTKMAMSHLRATGRRFSREAPYGHSYEEGKMVPNQKEQVVLNLMKELRTDRIALRQIPEILKERGFTNRKGMMFHFQSIAKILKDQP